MAIEFETDTPIYLQISEMIREAILTGDFKEGEAIPSVRQISVEQNLNPQTVLNATQILINQELIEKKRGLGLYVQKGAQEKLQRDERHAFRETEVPKLIDKARLLGFSRSELLQMIEQAYQEKD